MKVSLLRWIATGVLLLALAPFAGAAHAQEEPASALVGTRWQLVSWSAAGTETVVVGGTPVTLEFRADGRAGGSGGCNNYGGTYVITGDSIVFSQIASTLMACLAEGVMEQEAAYFAALQTAQRYEMTDDTLTIFYAEGQLNFTRIAALDLDDVTWTLVSYGAIGAQTAVVGDEPITLDFAADNRFTGYGGCNRYSGSYELAGAQITIGPILSTRRACLSEQLSAQESAYFAALEAATGFTLSDTALVITYGDDQQLTFTPDVAANLEGTVWQLVSYGAAGKETTVLADTAITLNFNANGEAGGSGGCNGYGGSYEITGESITFSRIVSTMMACSASINRQEQLYFAALQSAQRYELSSDTLTIFYADGQQLNFARAASAEATM